MPSGKVFITLIGSDLIGILSCEKKQAMTLQSGIFSTKKTLSAAEETLIKTALTAVKVAANEIVKSDQTKCKN